MKSFIIAVGIAFAIFAHSEASAQCCSAGSPSSANCTLTDGGSGLMQVGLSFINSKSDVYYYRNTKLDKKYSENYFSFSALSLNYGISSKLKVNAELGYFFNKEQNLVIFNRKKYTSGISDLSLGFSYKTYSSDDQLFDIYQSAKITLPVGSFNQEYEGVILPIDFQPSSGNKRYNVGIALSKKFENSDFSLLSYNYFETSQAVETDNTSYRYGNIYNFSISAIYNLLSNLTASLQTRCEIKDMALQGDLNKPNSYSYVNASGGVLWFATPQIVYSYNGFNLSAHYSAPIYKNVNGEQLTNKYSFAFNISKSINFNSEQEIKAEKAIDESLLKVAIRVEGNCDMCKDRIEKLANEMKNVASSEWSADTKSLTLYYKDAKPDIDKIEQALADLGHDTEHYKAKNEVYEKLPKCCLYRK